MLDLRTEFIRIKVKINKKVQDKYEERLKYFLESHNINQVTLSGDDTLELLYKFRIDYIKVVRNMNFMMDLVEDPEAECLLNEFKEENHDFVLIETFLNKLRSLKTS